MADVRRLDQVAVANLACLITHQIDAAYWHEWDMFHVPGGIQVFNVLNAVIFVGLLACLVALVRRQPGGWWASWVLVAASGVVLPIHGGFALAGHTEFALPVSVLVIVGTAVLAVWQAVLTLRHRAAFGR